MFFRLKQSGSRSYLQIVKNRRENGAVRQHVIATLGRLDELAARGSLAALLASGARYCDQILALSALADEDSAARLSARRLGGPLLFGRLCPRIAGRTWRPSSSGCGARTRSCARSGTSSSGPPLFSPRRGVDEVSAHRCGERGLPRPAPRPGS